MEYSSVALPPGRTARGPLALVIDDSESHAAFIRTILESVGFRVDHAPDGATGLEKAATTCPDLVLLDLIMPRFDGLGFLRRFQSTTAFAQTPVIVVSASQSIDTITSVCSLGARDFISKPIDPSTLIKKARRHARCGRVERFANG